MTPGKMAMIEASRSPAEEILDHLRETLDGDLVTRKMLKIKVRTAARILGHECIEIFAAQQYHGFQHQKS